MDLTQRFKEFIEQERLFTPSDTLLVAVSGGIDSAVLCELCYRCGYKFSIAHCNFRLRGEESERDEQFVRHIGGKYNVEVQVKHFDTEKFAAENKLGIQEAARELRYKWFIEIIESASRKSLTTPDSRLPTVLLTAHHADDNVETVLMNFCRGTGLRGLQGIPVKSGFVRRPLLSFWKDELIAFAQDQHVQYVEDSSNQSSKYARNLFRNEIIPLISRAYPQVKGNLKQNIERFQDLSALYRISVGAIKAKLCKAKGEEVHIPIKQLLSYQSMSLIFELISDYGFTEKQVDEVMKLAHSDSGKFISSPAGGHRIIKFRNWFIISRQASPQPGIIVINPGMSELMIAGQKLLIEETAIEPGFRPPPATSVACFDANEIGYPLIVRKWKQGDYFYPLGMKRKKKLARFFIDQKTSKTEREKIFVVEMNKKILWVVGMRIDDRYKVTDKTKRILRMSLATA